MQLVNYYLLNESRSLYLSQCVLVWYGTLELPYSIQTHLRYMDMLLYYVDMLFRYVDMLLYFIIPHVSFL